MRIMRLSLASICGIPVPIQVRAESVLLSGLKAAKPRHFNPLQGEAHDCDFA